MKPIESAGKRLRISGRAEQKIADGGGRLSPIRRSYCSRKNLAVSLGDVRGKDVCVLGSGDTVRRSSALAGMGARVTSVDITRRSSFDHARRRARELGAHVTFVCSNVTALNDRAFDVVYTGGHVAVWVSNLRKYYAEASRILRSGGLFVINEYHPFRRLWKENVPTLEMNAKYFERGTVHVRLLFGSAQPKTRDDYRCHEFHWMIGDFVSAAMEPGNELLTLQELGEAREGWEQIPSEGLPQFLLIAGARRCGCAELGKKRERSQQGRLTRRTSRAASRINSAVLQFLGTCPRRVSISRLF